MRFHVVNLPHTATQNAFSWCAYSCKVTRFATMMTRRGHTVYVYAAGPDANDAECEECVRCVEPPPDASVTEPEWTTGYFRSMNGKAVAEIRERLDSDRDLICLIGGNCQQPIAEAFPRNMSVEFGIGYTGTFSPYRVWESYAWMHTCYGEQQRAASADGRYFEAVIPNYFDVDQFPPGDGSGDYLLFVGRLIERKGFNVAVALHERTGLPLKIAGHGTPPEGDGIEYMGVVGPEERAELMGNARCVLVPTQYVEPFGGVAVEAQLCGTPVLATDWGAFSETVEVGVSGYRPHELREWVEAAEMVKHLDRDRIRDRAISLYSTEVVALQYERYFERLQLLWGAGWPADDEEAESLIAAAG